MSKEPGVKTTSPRIVAFGEVLWDMLPSGKKLGGAPVNFLYHASTLGASVRALTKVGSDQLGAEIVERIHLLKLSDAMIQRSPTAPTGTVLVSLDDNGAPQYEIVQNVAWDEIEIDDQVADSVVQFLSRSDSSIFYFGSLALRSPANRNGVANLLQKLPANTLRFCDLNIRAPFYSKEIVRFTLDVADVYKLNDEEALELDLMFNDLEPSILSALAEYPRGIAGVIENDKDLADKTVERWARRWSQSFDLKAIVLTCGAHGAYLYHNGALTYARSVPVQVKDTVGAGDSFAAVCLFGLVTSQDEEKTVRAASDRASYVCSQDGATPEIPPHLLDVFEK